MAKRPKSVRRESGKLERLCTAGVVVRQTLSQGAGKGKVTATFNVDHHGHSLNLDHLNVPRTERKRILERIESGLPAETILDEIRASASFAESCSSAGSKRVLSFDTVVGCLSCLSVSLKSQD